jgi:hypothetical protein
MQTPHSLAEAKAMLKAEETKVFGSLDAIIGSRWLMAILATTCLAFGLHALYAPTWLPSFGGLSLTTLGLPNGIDFGALGEQAQQAADAAQRQDVSGHVQALAQQHADLFPTINLIGFGVCLALLLVNMTVMTKRRPVTRG